MKRVAGRMLAVILCVSVMITESGAITPMRVYAAAQGDEAEGLSLNGETDVDNLGTETLPDDIDQTKEETPSDDTDQPKEEIPSENPDQPEENVPLEEGDQKGKDSSSEDGMLQTGEENPDGTETVSGNDEQTGALSDDVVYADGTSEDYPLTGRFQFTDVSVTPSSYSAQMTAVSGPYVSAEDIKSAYLTVIYSEKREAIEEFCRGRSYATYEDFKAAPDVKRTSLTIKSTRYKGAACEVTAEFGGLAPGKAYSFRIVENLGHFETVPESFTTKAAVTQTKVTLKDVAVNEIGYRQARVIWTVENPDLEYVATSRLYYRTADGAYVTDSNEASVKGTALGTGDSGLQQYYAVLTDLEAAQKVKARVKIYIGDAEERWLESEEISLTPRSFSDAQISVEEEVSSDSYKAKISLTPGYSVDSDKIKATVWYRKKGDSSYSNRNGSVIVKKGDSTGTASIMLPRLLPVPYEYYITLEVENEAGSESVWNVKGSGAAPETFTPEVTAYEDSEFPDEVFRNYLKKSVGIAESEKLISSDLEKITSVTISRSQAEGDIRSLKGISKLENLTRLAIQGHCLTDADELGEELGQLKKLSYLDLSDNDLTTMPDLSRLAVLTSDKNLNLNRNRMPDTEKDFVEGRLPSNFKSKTDWRDRTFSGQRGEVSCTLAPEYYVQDGMKPFAVSMSGLKWDDGRKYTLSVTVGGDTVSGDGAYIKDISALSITVGVPCAAIIQITDNYGNQYLGEDGAGLETQLLYTEVPAAWANTVTVPQDVYGVRLDIEGLPENCVPENISEIGLVDQEGRTVETACGKFRDPNTFYIDGIPEGVGDWNKYSVGLGESGMVRVHLQPWLDFVRYLSAGDYDLRISLKAGEPLLVENALSVLGEDLPVLESFAYSRQDGTYLYVVLSASGARLEPEKLRPVLYEGSEAVTAYEDGSVTYDKEGNYVYRLRKLDADKYWNKWGETSGESKTLNWRFEADEGYQYIDHIKDKTIVWWPSESGADDVIVSEYYNYRKGVFVVNTEQTVPDGTKLLVKVNDWWYGHSGNKQGEASGIIKNYRVEMPLIAPDGSRNALGAGEYAFRYELTYPDGHTTSFRRIGYNGETADDWVDFISSTEGEDGHYPFTDMVLYQPAGITSFAISMYEHDQQVASRRVRCIVDADGVQRGPTVTLQKKGKKEWGYTHWYGEWKSGQGLEAGSYTIADPEKIEYGGYKLIVYDDDTFYMDGQSAGIWTDEEGKQGISVAFSAQQAVDAYVSRYGRQPTAAKAWEYWQGNGYAVQIFDRSGKEITGWTADHADWTDESGVPVNVQYASGGTLEKGTADHWEGEPQIVGGYIGSAAFLRVYLRNFPQEYAGCYVRITKNGQLGVKSWDKAVYYEANEDADSVHGQWHRLKPADRQLYFTRSVYEDSWYASYNITGLYAAHSSFWPVTVTISRPDGGEVKCLEVQPAAGSRYAFTAADLAGTNRMDRYVITAAGADGCGVSAEGWLGLEGSGGHTPNYTLDRTKLEFDLSIDEVQPVKLQVVDGANVVSAVAWSSTDESVAGVAGGLVTPTGAGTAKILAAVQGGPVLTCEVTVTKDKVASAVIGSGSGEACTLYVNGAGGQVTDQTGRADVQRPLTAALRLHITPDDTTGVTGITWTSEDGSVAEVTAAKDRSMPMTVTVTAKKAGQTKIKAIVTVKSGEALTAEYPVTVKKVICQEDLPADKQEEALRRKLRPVLTNEQLTLADVLFPAEFGGWEWRYPDVSLTQFAGIQEKAFAARYCDPGDTEAEAYRTGIPVSLYTVTGIAVGADSASVHRGNTKELSVLWSLNGTQIEGDEVMTAAGQKLSMSPYADKVTWSVDKPGVASISGTRGQKVTLTALGAGKALVRAQVTFKDGKTYKAQYRVTVTDGEVADIQVTGIDGFTKDAQQGVVECYRTDIGETTENVRVIHVSVPDTEKAVKLTAASGSTKVATVGKITADETQTDGKKNYLVPVMLKSAGTASVTLAVNDSAKTTKEVRLYVTDPTPYISEEQISVNVQQTGGTVFFLYPCEEYQIQKDPELTGEQASSFILERGTGQDSFILRAKDGTGKGTYKLSLLTTVQRQTGNPVERTVDFKVKVVDQKPKFTLKQGGKVNLFYQNGQSSLTVTTNEILDKVELADCDFQIVPENGGYMIRPKQAGLAADCNKKGVLKLTFRGYREIGTNYMVAAERKVPKLALANRTVTLYPDCGIYKADVFLKEGKTDYDARKLTAQLGEEARQAGVKLVEDGGRFLLDGSGMTQNKPVQARITFRDEGWAEPVTLTCTVKATSGKPTVKLVKGTLQLNAEKTFCAYEAAETEIMWKSGAQFTPLAVRVSAADKKSQAVINSKIVFIYEPAGHRVIARLNGVDVEKGSYRFKVNVRVTDTLTVTAPLTVKVVQTAREKSVNVSARGSIDVLNRTGTFVTVTPKLQAINGTIKDVRLSGRAAHLFYAAYEDGKILIYARSDAALITRYAYRIKLNFTIENALGDEIRYQTKEIGMKLKQGKPRVSILSQNRVFFSASRREMQAGVHAALKGAGDLTVVNVELINNRKEFTCGYDREKCVISLRNTETAVKGRTYSLQLKVTFAGQADNEKPVIVKYSVKVK